MTLIDKRPEPNEEDMVKEVGSILSNNSATALSKLVGDRIFVDTEFNFFFMDEFNLEFDFKDEFANILSGLSGGILVGFSLEISDGAEGVCAIVFPRDDINAIINSVLPLINKKGAEVSEESKEEIMTEFSNISMQAYITALSKLINEPIKSSMPLPAKDMLGSLYHFKQSVSKGGDISAVSLKTAIHGRNNIIKGKLVVFLTPETYRSMVSKFI
jgi:chemotaxis protein CheY-P-specific phosphatase CheC